MLRVKDKLIFAMAKTNAPVLKVDPNTTICFETCDCFNNQITSEDYIIDKLDWDHINPATGPVYINGAMPGDILKVKIEKIELKGQGTMCAIPDNGVLGDKVKHNSIKKIEIKDDLAYFNDHALPLNKMIGVIGVAPKNEAIACGTPGSHGGNMDNTKIAEGSTLYLPIFQEGALFALGDVHACMGDGEIMVSGVEIAADVTVTLDLLKGLNIENPLLEDKDYLYTIASNANLDQAIYTAVLNMNEIIQKQLNYDLNEAGMLMSACGNLEFCQVVDPEKTVRFKMPKRILPKLF